VNVLVDTCIWSLALRRNPPGAQLGHLEEFKELINEARVQIIGPVRQEILSGIKSERQFEQLREYLSAFPDREIITGDFEQAARFFNLARSKGIQGSNTDFLICAVAARNNLSIFTVDQDFLLFRTVLPLRLHELRV
jgi:predicted nucleic acid-binding protein